MKKTTTVGTKIKETKKTTLIMKATTVVSEDNLVESGGPTSSSLIPPTIPLTTPSGYTDEYATLFESTSHDSSSRPVSCTC